MAASSDQLFVSRKERSTPSLFEIEQAGPILVYSMTQEWRLLVEYHIPKIANKENLIFLEGDVVSSRDFLSSNIGYDGADYDEDDDYADGKSLQDKDEEQINK